MQLARDGCRIRGRATRLRLVVPLAFVLSSCPATAETYYVRASGSDVQDGLSPGTAFATIGRAADLLREPGDRVVVGPGTYDEGNIGPRGNGTPDDPIVFQADPSGAMTQDSPGPVLIVPPNRPVPPNLEDNTTGFLLFGKHDVVIERFAIEGAMDAGVQVRPHFSTGIDSTRITVRGNDIRRGRNGIHVVAAADVSIIGNFLHDNTDVALSLNGSAEIPLRPHVEGNVFDDNPYGVVLENTSGGEIVGNDFPLNYTSIQLLEASDLLISGNDIGAGTVEGSGRNLTFIDNLIGRQVRLETTGTLLFQQNHVASGMRVYSDPHGVLQLFDNELQALIEIRGSAVLDLQRNEARTFEAVTQGAITATENNFSGVVRLLGEAELEVSGNGAASLRARGSRASVTDNQIRGRFEITANAADVRRNGAGRLRLFQIPPEPDSSAGDETPWVVADNGVDDLLEIGTKRGPLPAAIVRGNLGGILQIYVRNAAQVSRNDADSITCVFSNPESDLLLTDNSARGGRYSGLVVVGAGDALVETNTSTDNAESGIAIRRTKNITVAGNTFRSNGTGGVAVGTSPALGGDCNGDGKVAVDEIVVCASIALGQSRLTECDAVDFNDDERATIDEVVRAVAGALGLVAPLPPEIRDGDVLIRDNVIEDNGEFGIKVSAPGSVSALGNRILRNGGIGIAAEVSDVPQQVEIIGNVIGVSAAEGILVSGSERARVRNNFVFSNGQAGILLRDALGVEIVNNLIYANDDDGIAVGVGTTLPSPNAMILDNTLYANRGWGVTIGTAGAPSEGTVILNNIFDRNSRGGIASDLGSLGGLTIGFNLNNDGYSHEVTPSVTDFPADPRFVDPAGADGILGADGFSDDDFHLEAESAAVDAGSATAAELRITGSAISGLDTDEGIVDLGFHYGAEAANSDSGGLKSD